MSDDVSFAGYAFDEGLKSRQYPPPHLQGCTSATLPVNACRFCNPSASLRPVPQTVTQTSHLQQVEFAGSFTSPTWAQIASPEYVAPMGTVFDGATQQTDTAALRTEQRWVDCYPQTQQRQNKHDWHVQHYLTAQAPGLYSANSPRSVASTGAMEAIENLGVMHSSTCPSYADVVRQTNVTNDRKLHQLPPAPTSQPAQMIQSSHGYDDLSERHVRRHYVRQSHQAFAPEVSGVQPNVYSSNSGRQHFLSIDAAAVPMHVMQPKIRSAEQYRPSNVDAFLDGLGRGDHRINHTLPQTTAPNSPLTPASTATASVASSSVQRRRTRSALKTRTAEYSEQCNVCGNFYGRSEIRKHIERHSDGARRYHCATCGTAFQYPKDMRRHEQTHTPAGSETSTSLLCAYGIDCNQGKPFSRFDNLKRHIETQHTDLASISMSRSASEC